jgi:hypothetical protein
MRAVETMARFFDGFTADPECAERSLPWLTSKPLFHDAIVAYAPPYPEYSKLKISRLTGAPSDPGSPKARLHSTTVEVIAYSTESNGSKSAQEQAWEFLVTHSSEIEASLRRKLFAYHRKSLTQFLDEYLPDSKPMQKYWKEIEQNVSVHDATAVNQLFRLAQIGLADTGLDECGYCSFEFQTGWDRDHGLGIIMHKTNVLASGGMGELIYNPQHILSAVKSVQSYDFDEGDLRLET